MLSVTVLQPCLHSEMEIPSPFEQTFEPPWPAPPPIFNMGPLAQGRLARRACRFPSFSSLNSAGKVVASASKSRTPDPTSRKREASVAVGNPEKKKREQMKQVTSASDKPSSTPSKVASADTGHMPAADVLASVTIRRVSSHSTTTMEAELSGKSLEVSTSPSGIRRASDKEVQLGDKKKSVAGRPKRVTGSGSGNEYLTLDTTENVRRIFSPSRISPAGGVQASVKAGGAAGVQKIQDAAAKAWAAAVMGDDDVAYGASTGTSLLAEDIARAQEVAFGPEGDIDPSGELQPGFFYPGARPGSSSSAARLAHKLRGKNSTGKAAKKRAGREAKKAAALHLQYQKGNGNRNQEGNHNENHNQNESHNQNQDQNRNQNQNQEGNGNQEDDQNENEHEKQNQNQIQIQNQNQIQIQNQNQNRNWNQNQNQNRNQEGNGNQSQDSVARPDSYKPTHGAGPGWQGNRSHPRPEEAGGKQPPVSTLRASPTLPASPTQLSSGPNPPHSTPLWEPPSALPLSPLQPQPVAAAAAEGGGWNRSVLPVAHPQSPAPPPSPSPSPSPWGAAPYITPPTPTHLHAGVVGASQPQGGLGAGEPGEEGEEMSVGAKRGPQTPTRSLNKKARFRIKRAQQRIRDGVGPLALRTVKGPKPPPPACRRWMAGHCMQGEECPYSHAGVPHTAQQTCKYFLMASCLKGADCSYSHDLLKVPCKFFHLRGRCSDQDRCRFSHQPITEEEREALKQKVEEGDKKKGQGGGGRVGENGRGDGGGWKNGTPVSLRGQPPHPPWAAAPPPASFSPSWTNSVGPHMRGGGGTSGPEVVPSEYALDGAGAEYAPQSVGAGSHGYSSGAGGGFTVGSGASYHGGPQVGPPLPSGVSSPSPPAASFGIPRPSLPVVEGRQGREGGGEGVMGGASTRSDAVPRRRPSELRMLLQKKAQFPGHSTQAGAAAQREMAATDGDGAQCGEGLGAGRIGGGGGREGGRKVEEIQPQQMAPLSVDRPFVSGGMGIKLSSQDSIADMLSKVLGC